MITFKEFRKVMERRGRSKDELVRRFSRKIEDPRDFIERVWQGRFDDVVIPYRTVLAFYVQERRLLGGRTREIIEDFGGVFIPPLQTPQLEVF